MFMDFPKWYPFGDNLFDVDFSLPKLGRDLAVDLYEDGNNFIAEMNIPGVNPDKIDISIENHLLRVSGSREEKKKKRERLLQQRN